MIEKAFAYLKQEFDKQLAQQNESGKKLFKSYGFAAIDDFSYHSSNAVKRAGYSNKMIDAFLNCKPYCFNLSNKLDKMLKERYGYGE